MKPERLVELYSRSAVLCGGHYEPKTEQEGKDGALMYEAYLEIRNLQEQNAKMREALITSSIAWSSNEIYSQHFFNEALSLPDLATPILNKTTNKKDK